MSDIKILVERSDMVAIADAVRSKTDTTDEMTIGEIINGINNIHSGASDIVQWDGSYEEISSVVEITFTIDGVSYTAEEGMTWETYKGSEYDVLGLYDYIGTVASSVLSNSLVYYISGVEWTDTIQNGGTYTTGYLAGGAN